MSTLPPTELPTMSRNRNSPSLTTHYSRGPWCSLGETQSGARYPSYRELTTRYSLYDPGPLHTEPPQVSARSTAIATFVSATHRELAPRYTGAFPVPDPEDSPISSVSVPTPTDWRVGRNPVASTRPIFASCRRHQNSSCDSPWPLLRHA